MPISACYVLLSTASKLVSRRIPTQFCTRTALTASIGMALFRTSKKCSIQYMSDLHLEAIKYEFDTERVAPILVLGGDIGRFCDYEKYLTFLQTQCAKFDRVLLVAGNHEFYGSSREEGLNAARKLEKERSLHGKFVFMHRTRFDLQEANIILLGCTLQSHIAPDYKRLTNDFERIGNWSVAKHNAEHELDVEWLKNSLCAIAETNPSARVVIVTHYAPAFEKTCHPQHERNSVSQCFSSDTLVAFRNWVGAAQVTHWVFGHTHWNTRFKFGKTVVTSNHRMNDSRGLSWLQKRNYRPFDMRATLQI